MIYNIYCDESCHLEHDGIKPMMLGAVWCPMEVKDTIFSELRQIKVRHGLKPTCELKWNAVSPSKLAYYEDVVDYFFSRAELHFRCLVVPNKKMLNHELYGQSHDQFYYKMYFDLLKTLLVPQNTYNIYIDIKDTQGAYKVRRLEEVLSHNAYDFDKHMITRIQQVNSAQVELVELADFLTGAIGYAQRGLKTSEAKLRIIELIRQRSGYSLSQSTLVREDKMNLFFWKGRIA